MHAIRHSLRLLGILGAVFFAAAPASAQCTEQWLPGEGVPGLDGGDPFTTSVRTSVVYDDGTGPALYVAGLFTIAGDVFANGIARWDGSTWSPLGSGMGADVNMPYVAALTVFDGKLIAGGGFTTAGGIEVNNIASWDGTNWMPLDSGMNNPAFALTVYNGELIAGGFFTTAGGIEVNNIASWDGTTWSPLDDGMNGTVAALTVYNGELIAGGGFTSAGGVSAHRIAKWDGTAWSPLGSGMSGGGVGALTVYSGELIAGGSFNTAGGTPANRIARWDGTIWSPLGSGMGGATHLLRLCLP